MIRIRAGGATRALDLRRTAGLDLLGLVAQHAEALAEVPPLLAHGLELRATIGGRCGPAGGRTRYPHSGPRSPPRRRRSRGWRQRAYTLVVCPDEEFESQGCNGLTLEPGGVVICAGNPPTTARLREHGAEVIEYQGDEISVARISGPTCNTRPLLRLA